MGEANKQNYKLPDGYEVVQLEAMSAAEKTKAMTEIHALLHNVYGKWADMGIKLCQCRVLMSL